jgi:hypothetical protein
VVSFVLLHRYFAEHQGREPSWRSEGILQLLGQDQMNVYGQEYLALSWFALAWGVLCVVAAVYDWIFRKRKPANALWLALELYAVAVVATVCLPENFRIGLYAGWVGLLVSRLTLVTAVFGLLVFASLRLPRWFWRGATVAAAIFFVFLYRDTGKLDRMEANARKRKSGEFHSFITRWTGPVSGTASVMPTTKLRRCNFEYAPCQEIWS